MPKPLNLTPEVQEGLDAMDRPPASAPEFDHRLLEKLGATGIHIDSDPERMHDGDQTELESLPGIEAAHSHASKLFGRIDIIVPEISEFQSAGINFERLFKSQEVLERLGLEPAVIFSPSLPHPRWSKLYAALQADETVNKDKHIKNGGVWFHDDIKAAWSALQSQEPDDGAVLRLQDNALTSNAANIDWRVSVIATTPKAPFLNTAHDGTLEEGSSHPKQQELLEQLHSTSIDNVGNIHPTIDSYLTTQALRLSQGLPPLDDKHGNLYYWSWLNGTFNTGSGLQAPAGLWFSDDGRVSVSHVDVGIRRDDRGGRPSVWE